MNEIEFWNCRYIEDNFSGRPLDISPRRLNTGSTILSQESLQPSKCSYGIHLNNTDVYENVSISPILHNHQQFYIQVPSMETIWFVFILWVKNISPIIREAIFLMLQLVDKKLQNDCGGELNYCIMDWEKVVCCWSKKYCVEILRLSFRHGRLVNPMSKQEMHISSTSDDTTPKIPVRVSVKWHNRFLTHIPPPWTKWPPIWHTIFWKAFSWMKMTGLRLKFHWNLFPWVQLAISQHWFR